MSDKPNHLDDLVEADRTIAELRGRIDDAQSSLREMELDLCQRYSCGPEGPSQDAEWYTEIGNIVLELRSIRNALEGE